MQRTIGVLAAERIVVGVVEDNRVAGALRVFPDHDGDAGLHTVPADAIVEAIKREILSVADGKSVDAVGVGFPGIIRDGIVEESPNLKQAKGLRLAAALAGGLGERGIAAPVLVCNDADAVAAGIAATRGQLEKLVRVWTLGHGIGYGRYPQADGIWEGGHTVVTLDPKERYCGCGGVGHLEGIMGHRAMRLRFLDMEPDEVFAAAREGDARCGAFVNMWHRALAAATSNSIHMDGPGRFFISGMNAGFIDLTLLNLDLHEMVKMSPLQGSYFEVISTSDEISVIGAAVNANRAQRAAG